MAIVEPGSLSGEIRYAVRTLSRNPRFSVTGILTLVAGIGISTAIFSLLYAVVMRPLPYARPDRLVAIWNYEGRTSNVPSSAPDFVDWRKQNRVFEEIAGYSNFRDINLGHPGALEHIRSAVISTNFFHVLGVRPLAGRDFLVNEEQETHGRVALISHRFWLSKFGGRQALGTSMTLDAHAFTVIGIVPAQFWFPHMDDVDIWVPLTADAANIGGETPLDKRDSHWLKAIARLKAGVTIRQARDDMNRVADELSRAYPETNSGLGVRVTSLSEEALGNVRSVLLLLQGAAALVFVVACLNAAGLFLARSVERRGQVAIRLMMGGSSWRVGRQLFVEALTLCAAGGALGTAAAIGVLRIYASLQAINATVAAQGSMVLLGSQPMDFSRGTGAGINIYVVLFITLVVFISAAICSVAPLLMVSRTNPAAAVNAGGRTATSSWAERFRTGLVMAEIAVATILVLGASFLARSLSNLNAASPGFQPAGVLTGEIKLFGTKYSSDEQCVSFYKKLLAGLADIRGVRSAGLIDFLPFTGLHNNGPFLTEHNTDKNLWKGPLAEYRVVSSGYWRAMEIPILAGRDFTDQDTINRPNTIIISNSLAKEFFGTAGNAVGRRLKVVFSPNEWVEVVGVAGDVKHWSAGERVSRYIYFPIPQWQARSFFVVARTASTQVGNLGSEVQSALARVDPNQAIFDIKPMQERYEESFGPFALQLFAIGSFAGVTLFLACVGLYGIISFTIVQRTREIGVRVALGAQPAQIVGLVMKHCFAVTITGLLIGSAIGMGTDRLLAHFLYRVTASDPLTVVTAMAAILAVAAATGYGAGRRIGKLNAAEALRTY
jgi:putative ABC transport system permease protein